MEVVESKVFEEGEGEGRISHVAFACGCTVDTYPLKVSISTCSEKHSKLMALEFGSHPDTDIKSDNLLVELIGRVGPKIRDRLAASRSEIERELIDYTRRMSNR